MRIGVLSHSQKLTDHPQRFVSKNAANCLVRRLLAVVITKHLVKMVDPSAAGAPHTEVLPPLPPATYQHHIEPKLEKLSWLQQEISAAAIQL